MKLTDFHSVEKRRLYLEKTLKIRLKNIAKHTDEDTSSTYCENQIGSTILPLGVAGPLRIGLRDYYVPLATTEGALVASINRGIKAITESGGANVYAEKIGTTRGPVFYTGSLKKSKELKIWVCNNEKELVTIAEKTSAHLKYLKCEIRMLSDYVFIRFYFDTQDAMGMNMATIATEKIVEYIHTKTGISCLSVSGNYCIDKKPAWSHLTNRRGIEVWAETVLTKKVISEICKTTAQKMYDLWFGKCILGSYMAGSLGFNAQFANVVAAFFAATGQDIAHVVEGSIGITQMRFTASDGLSVSVYLPSVMLGTVGGGTKMKIKQEALSIIGAKTSTELATVLGAAVLAGEVSLIASLAEGTLGKTHEKLGR